MRNYMFRGFTVFPDGESCIDFNNDLLNGEWIYGGYFYDRENNRYIVNRYTGVVYDVIPETVSQYIGKVDKANRFIFENDIIEDDFGRILQVIWKDAMWCYHLIYCPPSKPQLVFNVAVPVRKWDNITVKVLGNIWTIDINKFLNRNRS